MMEYIIPIAIIVGLGLLAGVILTVAAKFMAVKEDETAAAILAVLPGANCGACGFAGCADYASALAADRSLPTNACPPGGNAVGLAISELLGMEFASNAGQFAVMHCSGTCDKTSYAMEYQGVQTCAANKLFFRGHGACEMACLGFGDCKTVCDYNAITMENGIAKINRFKCIGCGLCTKACPNQLIEIIPSDKRIVVGCSTKNTPEKTQEVCQIGCTACGACVESCKLDAIHIIDGIAVVDYEKCKNCGMCGKACPRGVIHVFPRIPAPAKAPEKKAEPAAEKE